MFTGRMSIGQGADRLNLSTRVVYRILRMSRTVADLEKVAVIGEHHLLEALAEAPTARHACCSARLFVGVAAAGASSGRRACWSVCLLVGVSVRWDGCRWREFW